MGIITVLSIIFFRGDLASTLLAKKPLFFHTGTNGKGLESFTKIIGSNLGLPEGKKTGDS